MLNRTAGATISEVVEATGWQPHTVRGALAGALKKRLGLTIGSEKVEGRGRVCNRLGFVAEPSGVAALAGSRWWRRPDS